MPVPFAFSLFRDFAFSSGLPALEEN